MLKKLLPDMLLMAGAGAVSYGFWLAYAPAGFVVAGLMALLAGIKMASLS